MEQTELSDFGVSRPPTEPLTELLGNHPFYISNEEARELRDFILGTAMYVEQLEKVSGEMNDDFWRKREHAYRIITQVLIDGYTKELEE